MRQRRQRSVLDCNNAPLAAAEQELGVVSVADSEVQALILPLSPKSDHAFIGDRWMLRFRTQQTQSGPERDAFVEKSDIIVQLGFGCHLTDHAT